MKYLAMISPANSIALDRLEDLLRTNSEWQVIRTENWDGPGRPDAYIGPYRDSSNSRDLANRITELEAERDGLIDESARLQALADASTEGICYYDKTAGQVLQCNQTLAEMFGYTMAEFVGMDAVDLMAQDAVSNVQMNRDASEPMIVRARKKNGRRFIIEAMIRDAVYQGREVLVVSVRDVTNRERAAETERIALERLLEIEKLKEMDRFKTRIINTAAHELKTPLTPMQIQARILSSLSADREPKFIKAADILERNIRRMSALVDDFLDVAKLESGHLVLEVDTLDIAQCIIGAKEAFEEMAHEKDITIKTQGVAQNIRGDPRRISQILYNLVSNAIKFSPEGAEINVTWRVNSTGEILEVLVQDRGRGLTRDQRKELFQPFSQVHFEEGDTTAGTGLGLYICRGIAEQHGGTIDATSAGPNRGTTFTVTLPVAGPKEKSATKTSVASDESE